ncbi:MAG: SufB/SufD family protein [Candidatus Bipolaricaulaceae bacterium]
MRRQDELRARAVAARDRVAPLGPDVDLNSFERVGPPDGDASEAELGALGEEERLRLQQAGIDPEGAGRGGSYFQRDAAVLQCGSSQPGVEILPIRQALATCPWVWDYYWKLVDVGTDKFTAAAELELHDGYVIRAMPGSKTDQPVQACLYLAKENLRQNVHNLVIAESGSELHVITGCATSPHLRRGLHVGVTEFFVKEDAQLTFTMVHNWAEDMVVRPRSVAHVAAGGLFLSNYICMRPVSSLQMYPTTVLAGEGAVGRFYSVVVSSPGSEHDIGSRIRLQAPHTRAEIVSRAISGGGRVIARGHLVGEASSARAHLECRGLLLGGGLVQAVPELEGRVEGVELSHEAAVGRIAQEEIHYLMARGLTEDEATSTIVRGFLSVDIPGLPPPLRAEIDRAVTAAQAGT